MVLLFDQWTCERQDLELLLSRPHLIDSKPVQPNKQEIQICLNEYVL